jgi:hypothetical protein
MKTARPVLLVFMAVSIAAPAIVKNVWPVYGPWLAHLAVRLAQEIAPTQHVIVAGTTVFTAQTEMRITTECSGASGVRTFSMIGTVVLLLNWRHAANLKFLLAYLGSVATLWLYNLARLAYEIVYGAQQYGVSEIMVVVVSGLLALAAVHMARPAVEPAAITGSVDTLQRG